ncbi:peptidase S28 [Ochromonadaceae sp. CCMP2298]|nr:peptidase S28 [Ochromonadaceae sp. CCMP2298]
MMLYILLSLLCAARAAQELPERARGGRAYREFLQRETAANPLGREALRSQGWVDEPLTWDAPVDHFSADNSTFPQRYFVDAQYWAGGPVFFLISGEGTLTAPPGGYVATLGKQYSALLISLEHRFYGGSIPQGSAATENYHRHLSVQQALADLCAFTDHYKGSVKGAVSVPWVIFGGSYSGGLASWYRSAYPQQSVGALSSSGVVHNIVDFYQFDMQVSAAAGNSCGQGIRRVQGAFQRTAERGEPGLQTALGKLHCEADMSADDFYFMIADSWSMAVQYSAKSQLCAALSSIPPDAADAAVMDAFAAFSVDFWGAGFCSMGFYNTRALADPARWDVNSRSWRYQTCAQVGYFNTAPPSGALRAPTLDLPYHLAQCAAIFGVPMFPNSLQMTEQFGGQFPSAGNTFYSHFADDPWQRAGVSFAPSAAQPYHLAQCDDCGHCLDLHSPSPDDAPELQESRAEFEGYLAQWLAPRERVDVNR